jgi:hypothetical protein
MEPIQHSAGNGVIPLGETGWGMDDANGIATYGEYSVFEDDL